MALINCSECGSQMSDKAQSCPKCGAPNPNAPLRMPMGFTFNPCAWHSDMPAVSSCVTCGKAMCKNCVDSAPFEIDNKPQCNECSLCAELITYTKDAEWAEVKVDGIEGFAASPYLLEWTDFNLLNGVWGSADVKEYIESQKQCNTGT